jgi:hypothetical protein
MRGERVASGAAWNWSTSGDSPFCFDLAPGASGSEDDGGINIPNFATATWNATLTNQQDTGP